MKQKSKIILVALILLSICIGGGLAAIYWSSQTITYNLVIEGQLSAITNIDWPEDVADYPDLVTLSERATNIMYTFNDSAAIITMIVDPATNIDALYIESLNVTCSVGCSATAHIYMQQYMTDTLGTYLDIGPIATDGSESVKAWIDGINGDWPFGTIWGTRYHAIIIEIALHTPTTPGTYPFTAVIELGDGL